MPNNQKKASIVGRTVAALVANGVDGSAIAAVRAALESAGATIKVVGPELGKIKSKEGDVIDVNLSFSTARSVLFDAVFVPGGEQSVATLCADVNAVLFVKEAYKQGKAVAACENGGGLIAAAALSSGALDGKFRGPGVLRGPGKTASGTFIKCFIAAIAKHRFTERPELVKVAA